MAPVPSNSRNQQLQESMAAAVIARQEGEFRRRRREGDSGSSTPVTEEPTKEAAPPSKEQLREAALRKQHNDELKALARQAAEDAARKKKQLWLIAKAAIVVSLLALLAWTSQLGLAPVYGGLPSGQLHGAVVAVGCFSGWAFNEMIRETLRQRFPRWLGSAQLLPVAAAFMPTTHMLLERRSALLGSWGPLVTEIVTLLPISVLSAAAVADILAQARVSDIVPMFLPLWVAESLPGLGAWLLYTVVRKNAPSYLWSLASKSVIFTVVGLQVLATLVYSGLAPSPALIVVGASVLQTGFYNYHLQSETGNQLVNSALEARGWRLIDREHSITGYVSVLENVNDGYRVMRCDHSLLGGEWIPEEGAVEKPGLSVAEPVYGVFAMLEAVRLVHRREEIEDSEAKALVIGLGVGTTPSAFVTHGIKTTVVEIDPVVYKFAQQYFGLRENAPPIIDDATVAMGKLMRDWTVQYDYIVHDVFTGGAEPEELFSADFLADLGSLLADDGVIALNYAGDMTLESTKQAIQGITQQFGGCRMFREYPPNSTLIAETGTDFANGVVFCLKNYGRVSFREPVREDFLQTYARQQFLKPQHEVNLAKFFQSTPRTSRSFKATTFARIARSCSGNFFNRGYVGHVEAKQPTNRVEAARGHWKIMRTVIPPSVWELW